MSRVKGSLTTGGNVATGTSAKTILQAKAATNHRAELTGWGVSFDGTTANNPRVLVELVYQTSAGTMTSVTAQKRGSFPEALETTGLKNASAEPTDDGDVIRQLYVDPQWGYAEYGAEGDGLADIYGGGRLGIRCTTSTSVNAVGFMDFSE